MRVVTFEGASSGSPSDNPEWHAWRALGLGGSDAGVVALHQGLIRTAPDWFKTANQLWELKTGRKEDSFRGNWATQRGTQGESIIHRLYEDRTGNLVAPMFGEMDSWPVNRTSFDGLTLGGEVIIEIKCPNEAVHQMAHAGQVVPYYRPQVVHQALSAWDHPDTWNPDHEVHFVSGRPEDRDIAIVRIQARRMREFGLRLFDAEQAFWQKVETDAAVAGEGWEPLAEAWLSAKRAADAAQALEDKARDELVAYAKASGREALDGSGVSIAMEARRGSVDYRKVLLEHGANASNLAPDVLEGFRRAGSSSWVVRLQK